jgi:ParB family chromosome partitioning protein
MNTMLQDLSLNLIDSDWEQPRWHFDKDKLKELAQSMGVNGLIVPVLVRPSGDGRFIIVHGERRCKAAQMLDWETIRAEVRGVSPQEARWLALAENVQRQDLSPIEEARAYQARLTEGITQAELGQRIGKSPSYIAQKLRLLKLPDDVRATIARGDILEGHARQLLRLKDAGRQSELCRQAVVEGWTVAQTRVAVDDALTATPEERMKLETLERETEIGLDSLERRLFEFAEGVRINRESMSDEQYRRWLQTLNLNVQRAQWFIDLAENQKNMSRDTLLRVMLAMYGSMTPGEFVVQYFGRSGGLPGHNEPYPEERLPDCHDPPVEIRLLPISQIVDDPALDPRGERDPKYAQWLAEIFVTLPPIAVFDIDGEYVLSDGRYRVMAARLLKLREIECRIYAGTDRFDAYVYGVAANAVHGRPATPQQLKKTLERIWLGN